MSGYRLPNGGKVDRSRSISFTWDDTRYLGFGAIPSLRP